MKLKLNMEYAKRHAFAGLLMAGLGCWFGYDGVIRYPSMTAGDLYRSIEKSDPPPGLDLDAFKRQKTQTQYGFAGFGLLAGIVIGLRLLKSARFSFAFDDAGFTWNGRRFTREDIAGIDRSAWERKSILILTLKDGQRITLDAWHHEGVREFAEAYGS